MTLISLSQKENWGNLRAFMKMSAKWCWVETWKILISRSWIFSLTKWQSMSMFLVLSWNTISIKKIRKRLATMHRAAWLSHYNTIACECSIWKSFSNDTNQTTSHGCSHSYIFNFSRRSRYYLLFLCFPWTKEDPMKTK